MFQIVSDAISTNRILTIMKTKLIFAAFSLALMCVFSASVSAQSPAPSSGKKPNILVIWGDDIGWNNPSMGIFAWDESPIGNAVLFSPSSFQGSMGTM